MVWSGIQHYIVWYDGWDRMVWGMVYAMVRYTVWCMSSYGMVCGMVYDMVLYGMMDGIVWCVVWCMLLSGGMVWTMVCVWCGYGVGYSEWYGV